MMEPKGSIFISGVCKLILIGLGANLDGPHGPPDMALKACVGLFKEHGVGVGKASSIWKTAPVPVSDQPWYRNAVCMIETDLGPLALLAEIKRIEREFGREVSEINAPRVIDLDILTYQGMVMEEADLVLPHPRMCERAFVLYPLQEVAPGWHHPVVGKTVDQMIAELPLGQKFERIEGSRLL